MAVSMRKSWWWAVVFVLVATASLSARDVELQLKDGRTLTGELVTETPAAVTLRIKNIEASIPRTEIRPNGIRFKLSLAEEYQQRRQGLADDDYDGRFELARWLFTHKTNEAYKLALTELDDVLTHKPDMQRAKYLRDAIQNILSKEAAAPPATPVKPAPSGDTPANPEAALATGTPGKVRLLTPQEINLIRLYEINLDGERPQVSIPREVIQELFKQFRDDPVMKPYLGTQGQRRFYSLQGYQQLGIIFDAKARDLYPKILVRTEPAVIRRFRTLINTNYLVRYCGQCHSEGKAKGFYILTQRPNTDATVYTNYLILARSHNNNLPFLFRDEPQRSPLVQMGLPRKDATTPHPDVRGWKPFFTQGTRDPRYTEMLDWIKSIYTAGDEYPIDFKVPGDSGTSSLLPGGVAPTPGTAPGAGTVKTPASATPVAPAAPAPVKPAATPRR